MSFFFSYRICLLACSRYEYSSQSAPMMLNKYESCMAKPCSQMSRSQWPHSPYATPHHFLLHMHTSVPYWTNIRSIKWYVVTGLDKNIYPWQSYMMKNTEFDLGLWSNVKFLISDHDDTPPHSLSLKSTRVVNLLSKLSIIFKEWRVVNNMYRGGARV